MSALFLPQPGQFGFNIVLDEAVATAVPASVAVFVVSGASTTASAVRALQANNRAVAVLFDAASVDSGSADEAALADALVGNKARLFSTDPCCPTRSWVDVRSSAVRNLMTARLTKAAALGADAVVWNGLPAPTDDTGLGLTQADIVAYAAFLRTSTRAKGLSVGLGQSLEQMAALVGSFDFAVTQDVFSDSALLQVQPFLAANKAVFDYEIDDPQNFLFSVAACAARGRMDMIVKGADADNIRNQPLKVCGSYAVTARAPPTAAPALVTTPPPARPTTSPWPAPPGSSSYVATTAKTTAWPASADLETEFTGSLFVPAEPAPENDQSLVIGLAAAGVLLLLACLAIALFVCRKSRDNKPPSSVVFKKPPTAVPVNPAASFADKDAVQRRPTQIAHVTTLEPGGATEATMLDFPSPPTNPELMRRHATDATLEAGELRREPDPRDDYEDLVLIPEIPDPPQIRSWQESSRRYEVGGWNANPPPQPDYGSGRVTIANQMYNN